MIKKFNEAWAENEKRLENKIVEILEKQDDWFTPFEYKDLLELVIDEVINPYLDYENLKLIHTINTGSYQGTHIYIISQGGYWYEPDNLIRTYVWYGSCSVCDALLGANGVGDYKQLCLHLLQHMEYMDYKRQSKEVN
jgi:hypothetical protein